MITRNRTALAVATSAFALVLAVAATPARAELVIQSSMVGGVPTGVAYVNFDGLALGSGGGQAQASNGQFIQVNFGGDARAVQGAASGLYAAPFLSGNNGASFGAGNGADTTTYLTSGSAGAYAGARVEMVLPELAHYFGLLWGSVDAYNFLDFYGANGLIGTIDGADVAATADGNQGAEGTYYVNITSDEGFTRVVARSNGYAFELDNVAFNAESPVPEPMTLSLLGLGLLGLGIALRRRRAE